MTTNPPINDDTQWYYADGNNQPQGPVPFEELNRLYAQDIIVSQTPVIEEGGTEWKTYHDACCWRSGHAQTALPPIPPSLSMNARPQPAFSSSQTPVMEAVGIGGSIQLFQDRIRIKRKGVLAFLSHGLKGDKDIFLSQITAVQFKAAGFMNGYIQFSFPGASAAERGVFQAGKDENTVLFDKTRQPMFEKIKRAIEKYQATRNIGIQQAATARFGGMVLAFALTCGMVFSSSSALVLSQEPTPQQTLPYIVAGKEDLTVEQQLALVNANKGALRSNDVSIARFRYLLDRAAKQTGDSRKNIADAACKGQGLIRENGKDVSLLTFMEGVDKFLSTPGLPKMKYFDAALMVAIEASK